MDKRIQIVKTSTRSYLTSNVLPLTLDELAAERVAGGAKPSKTDTAAPTSGSNIELVYIKT